MKSAKTGAPKITRAEAERFRDLVWNRGAGAARAISALDAANALGLVGNKENKERRVRVMRETCLRQGWIICSGPMGYFRPATLEEIVASVARRRSQAMDMLALISLEEKLGGQLFAAPVPKPGRRTASAGQLTLEWTQ